MLQASRSPRNLLIAYGTAALTTFVIVPAGIYAFWANGVSYSADVSAIICATQNPDVSNPGMPEAFSRESDLTFYQIKEVVGKDTI